MPGPHSSFILYLRGCCSSHWALIGLGLSVFAGGSPRTSPGVPRPQAYTIPTDLLLTSNTHKMRQQLLLVATLVLLSAESWLVQARDSPDCPGGCIIASVLAPKRECQCVVPNCSWQRTFGLRSTRRRRSNGRTRRPQVGGGRFSCMLSAMR